MTQSETSDEQSHPRQRRRFRTWIALAGLACGLAWLNGPGLRWLVPEIAAHFLGKSGLHGGFDLEGSLTGGISLTNLHLASAGTLAEVSVHRARPVYRFSRLIRGRLDGIEIDGLHAELRLGLEKPEGGESQPPDLEQIVRSIRAARDGIVPLSLRLGNISLEASRDEKPVIALAGSSLQHAAGDPVFKLELGAITDAAGRAWPAQQSLITWNAEELTLDHIDPLPGAGLRDLVVTLPESGGPAADAEVRIHDAVFIVGASPGFSSIRVDLREGRLDSRWLAENFGLELPASATLTSLSLNLDDLLPAPESATGAVRILLEDAAAGGWTMRELNVDARLQADGASLAAAGQAPGTGFSFSAEAAVSRAGGGFSPSEVSGRFNVADVSGLVAALSERVEAIDPQAPAPQSMVDGGFRISLEKLRPSSAEVDLTLKPADPATVTAVSLNGRWRPDGLLTAGIEMEGVKARADYRPEPASYDGEAAFDGFKTARIARWLAVFRAETGGAHDLTGIWRGGGEIKTGRHRGLLSLAKLDAARKDAAPVLVKGDLSYDWPAGFSIRDLSVRTGNQILSADAALAGGWLELSKLSWQDGGRRMASGSARLPAPADFSKWRDMLAHDARPLEVALDSEVLPLHALRDWLPSAANIDSAATGCMSLKVSGTYADPAVAAALEVRNLRAPAQPKLPSADLDVTITGRDGNLAMEGRLSAADFPAAVITASMPFRPAEWAENPDSIRSERISARADLPRLDLSRFAPLVPGARRVSGFLTANIDVAGELGSPVLNGRIGLAGGGLEFKDERIPPVTGIGAAADLAPERITLRDLRADIAGGTLRGGGSLALQNGKPGSLDLRVTGNHLPLLRNDSMIVRANADLRLAGDFQRAALAGTVNIVDSLFYRDIELLPIGTPFTTPSAAALPKIDARPNPAAAVPEPFRNWPVNILVRTGNPFLIRGNLASGRVDANVRVGGTLGNPAPDGEVRISDLTAALPFSTLTVRSGSLRFTPQTGFDPALEIRGSAEPRPYRVSLFVYGRASDPQLVLTSSPPLPENEIMTLLATGATTTGLEDPQAASSRAMQLLVEELRRGRFAVGKRLRPLLGLLDRVDFSLAEADPYSSESFSTATLAITDRWFLSAGMGADGDSRVMGIWRLSFR